MVQQWRADDRKWKQQVEALYEQRHQEQRSDAVADRKTAKLLAVLAAAVGIFAAILSAWLN